MTPIPNKKSKSDKKPFPESLSEKEGFINPFETREEYLEERKLLFSLKDATTQRFEQILITLSSSAIGLSILFVKDFVGPLSHISTVLLFITWVFLIVSLVSVLISQLLNRHYLIKIQNAMDLVFEGNIAYKEKYDSARSLGSYIKALSWISLGLFILSIILFVIFVGFNFQTKKNTILDIS
jgi:hypothetical protein